jgi:UDP-glucose 4-epimerase
VRDYVHVADLADAHILALDYLNRGGKSEFINLGTGTGYSVLEVIETARKVTGKPIPYKKEPRRAGDAITLVADARKAKTVLGWTAVQSDIASILKSQWDWRQRSKDPFKA